MTMDKISVFNLSLLIITSCFVGLLTLCFGICLTLWIRHRYNAMPSSWSRLLFRQKPINYGSPTTEEKDANINVLPTLSYSEPGSEPVSPSASFSPWSPLTPSGGRSFRTFQNLSDHQEEMATFKESYPTPRFHRSSTFGLNQPLSLGASSKTLPALPQSTRPRPSSLLIRTPSSSTVSSTAPSSESGTSASPADFEYFRSPQRGLEFLPSPPPDNPTTPYPPFFFIRGTEQRHKFRIGMIKITVKYCCTKNSLQINFLKGFQIPFHIQYKKYGLYVKFSLMIGSSKIRCSKPLKVEAGEEGDPIAKFEHEATSKELVPSSIVITLCKTMQHLDQGMVIGAAFLSLTNFPWSEGEDFDSGVLELPLSDCNPNQMIFCGGFLEGSLGFSPTDHILKLTDVRFCGMDFSKVHLQEERKDCVQIYLKITIYERSEPVFWRRTPPVVVPTSCHEVTMANVVLLEATFPKETDIQMVLSVRLKTGKRGERCVLGNIYLSDSWFKQKFALDKPCDPSSEIVNFHFSLDY